MKDITKQPAFWAGLLLASPVIYYMLYKLALEIWCIAYGLMY